jgi:hypothetical protein
MLGKGSLMSVLISICLLASGCIAFVAGGAAVGAGIVWYKGKLHDTVSAPLPRVHEAVRAGLGDLGIKPKEDKGDALTAELKAKLGDDREVWIDLKAETPTITKISIRVGLFGDEDFSRRILSAARKHL